MRRAFHSSLARSASVAPQRLASSSQEPSRNSSLVASNSSRSRINCKKLARRLPIGGGVFGLVRRHRFRVELAGMIGESLPGDVHEVVPVSLGLAQVVLCLQQQPEGVRQG